MRGNSNLMALPLAALRALAQSGADDVNIYLSRPHSSAPILYRRGGDQIPRPDFQRLQNAGVSHLIIEGPELAACEKALEEHLASLLRDPDVPAIQKASCVQHIGTAIARDLVHAPNIADHVDRAARLFDTMIDGVLSHPLARSTLLSMTGHHRSTASHMFAVGSLAILLGLELFGRDHDRLRALGLGGMLHDLGKVSIDEALLNKSGALTPEEVEIIRHHPVEGVRILGDDATVSAEVRRMMLEHHERFDGRGYPLGRSGGELLEESRILAIVDSFHAMIGQRGYRASLHPAEAVRRMMFHTGKQFDPTMLSAWVQLFRRSWRGLPDELVFDRGDTASGYHADHRAASQQHFARFNPRRPCWGALQAECIYTGRLAHASPAPDRFVSPLLDLSKSGVCLASDHPMYRGEIVSLRLGGPDGPWVRGMVRWCRRDGSGIGYRAGVQLVQRLAEGEVDAKTPVSTIGQTARSAIQANA